jgi:mono/diheme cytochrome c family protein
VGDFFAHSVAVPVGLSLAALAPLAALTLSLASCSSSSSAGPECGPPTDQAPSDLACTGLYSDFATKTVAPTARLYAPAAALWSDGYDKSRWIELPAGTTIDATSMDEWKFPVGTKVWKEFRSPERKIETRLLWKVKEGQWTGAAYVWSDDGTKATRAEGKNLTVAGAPYHVPTLAECVDCHKGRVDTLLGFEAVSLAQPAASGITLADLAAENRLAPPPSKTALTMDPGAAVLHVNCGVSCHNATSAATRHDSILRLRVSFDEATTAPVTSWQMYSSAVNVPAVLPTWRGGLLIAPGAPDKSVILSAMTVRGTDQMPPSTRDVDTAGVAAVEAFVRSLPSP